MCAAFLLWAFAPAVGRAETMAGALARAYANNPNIGQQRAALRALDENSPKARAGWLPTVVATGYAGRSYLYQRDPPSRGALSTSGVDPADDESLKQPRGQKFKASPRGYGMSVTQPIFDGFKTLNNVRQAESQIFGGREILRAVEQDTLLATATAYMDVLRDMAIVGLRTSNIAVLKVQASHTRERISIGQATEADAAQSEAALAQARSDYFAARGLLQASMATYRQLVGVEARSLQPVKSVESILPKTLDAAVEIALREHPAIVSALYAADAASFAVKITESALYPSAGITGSINRDLDLEGMTGKKSFTAAVVGQINVPIYQGGSDYASIRQAKERAGQARLVVDLERNQARANVATSWAQWQAAKAQILSTQSAVKAAEIALVAMRGEAEAGQRTTFDVLAAQQTLLNARVSHVVAQRTRVVSAYAILAASGQLTARSLGIPHRYDPKPNFEQVEKGRLGSVLRDPNKPHRTF